MKRISKWLVFLLLCGLIFRIVILSWSLQFRENTDVLRWRDWGRISYLHGLADTYKADHLTFGTLPNNMPPGTLYIVTGMYNVNLQVSKAILKLTGAKEGSINWVNVEMLNLFLRLPSIMADLAIGYLIYLIIKRDALEKFALLGSFLYLFNPVVLYNSAFWGQMDSLNNLMFFLALFFLFNKKYFIAILFVFLSLFIKFSLLAFLPIFLYLLFVSRALQPKKLVLFTTLSLIIIFILMIPISQRNIFWVIDYLKNNSLGEMQQITNYAFNFWWLVFHPTVVFENSNSLFSFSEIRLINSPLDISRYLFIPLQIWAIGLFLLFCVPIIKKLNTLKEKILHPQNLMLIFCLLSVISFLFLPRMHERYLYPLFPFLAVVVGLSGKYLKTFILFSVLNFVNLYIVWHPMKLWFLPYEFISNSNIQWLISFAIMAIGSVFYYKIIKLGFINEKRK